MSHFYSAMRFRVFEYERLRKVRLRRAKREKKKSVCVLGGGGGGGRS